MISARPVAAALAVALLPLAGCSQERDTTITVLAAASLTESFEDLANRFELDHPDVDVKLAFDSSATLAQQALEGAPADVLATADTATMGSAGDALATAPESFATNSMVLVTPADNPAGLTGFGDLTGTTYVVCVESAPCGRTARALLDTNGVTAEPASLEVDVKAVLAKVASDEADAGLVYATDAVAAAEDVQVFEVPGSANLPTTYPIALLEQSREPELAQEFVNLVFSPQGQQVLANAGFAQP